jgi:hypothetical protein
MAAFIILTLLVLAGPLALLYGVDSRVYEDRPRGWWPGSRS